MSINLLNIDQACSHDTIYFSTCGHSTSHTHHLNQFPRLGCNENCHYDPRLDHWYVVYRMCSYCWINPQANRDPTHFVIDGIGHFRDYDSEGIPPDDANHIFQLAARRDPGQTELRYIAERARVFYRYDQERQDHEALVQRPPALAPQPLTQAQLRRQRIQRLEDRWQIRRFRARRRLEQWAHDVHETQYRAVREGRPVPDRPYIWAAPYEAAHMYNDFLVQVPVDRLPQPMEICIICQENLDHIENTGYPHRIPCRHIFHGECITQYFAMREGQYPEYEHTDRLYQCPSCRATFRDVWDRPCDFFDDRYGGAEHEFHSDDESSYLSSSDNSNGLDDPGGRRITSGRLSRGDRSLGSSSEPANPGTPIPHHARNPRAWGQQHASRDDPPRTPVRRANRSPRINELSPVHGLQSSGHYAANPNDPVQNHRSSGVPLVNGGFDASSDSHDSISDFDPDAQAVRQVGGGPRWASDTHSSSPMNPRRRHHGQRNLPQPPPRQRAVHFEPGYAVIPRPSSSTRIIRIPAQNYDPPHHHHAQPVPILTSPDYEAPSAPVMQQQTRYGDMELLDVDAASPNYAFEEDERDIRQGNGNWLSRTIRPWESSTRLRTGVLTGGPNEVAGRAVPALNADNDNEDNGENNSQLASPRSRPPDIHPRGRAQTSHNASSRRRDPDRRLADDERAARTMRVEAPVAAAHNREAQFWEFIQQLDNEGYDRTNAYLALRAANNDLQEARRRMERPYAGYNDDDLDAGGSLPVSTQGSPRVRAAPARQSEESHENNSPQNLSESHVPAATPSPVPRPRSRPPLSLIKRPHRPIRFPPALQSRPTPRLSPTTLSPHQPSPTRRASPHSSAFPPPVASRSPTAALPAPQWSAPLQTTLSSQAEAPAGATRRSGRIRWAPRRLVDESITSSDAEEPVRKKRKTKKKN